ncbi:VPA1262 family N-terminal domain-containing protein, partial [Pasteurella multocida]
AISNISNPENDPWLEKGLPKSSIHKAKTFTSIERLNNHRSEFSVNDAHKDPWFDANIEIESYLKTIFPDSSNSYFFQKLSFDGESRLELVNWLRKVLKKYPNAQVAWFDPFMENVGINLLNRLGFSAGNYIVFTSKTQEGQDRINHLVKQCENWDETIGSVKLKVFGLEKLHDRMILIRENDGKPLAGYHLSNSIQRANENNPLLVTEIPLNILYPIFSYVDELIQIQEISDEMAIFDSTTYQPKSRNERKLFDTKSPYQFSKLGWVLSKWWQQPELENLSG